MKIVVTGATDFLGCARVRGLVAPGDSRGWPVRHPERAVSGLAGATCLRREAGEVDGEWVHGLDDASAVVHLAGEPVMAHRWNTAMKRRIPDSRELGMRRPVEATGRTQRRPKALLYSSGGDSGIA